ncbi:hypothetical protein LTR70_005223 [Exophiala xenobiotica]|uniref:DUF833 domain-containing protein n=1 Tax=Lithohypha guttulata TaxID=1690604 RepID=A0ABR0KBF3_9EURO|nr:hypothetical protein LTR24_004708 [Lithohypha guttulata]KAK5318927.1 hypothetical protein LTR70_005223 [Exophiala xenobiotica]
MCIALLSTAHPKYKLILLDNRDEYINRPTADATWWPSYPDVLGGRDLLREVQGTWLGVTKSGKIAVLTNFREDRPPAPSAVSRGEIIKKFLTEDVGSTEQFVTEVVNQGVARDAGGFSLVCGHIGKGDQLAVISNRAQSGAEVPWICGHVVQTVGLSNTSFGDRTWPKVLDGEELMLKAIRENISDDKGEEELIESFLALLSDDALTRKGLDPKEGLQTHILELRNTIRVPPLGRQDMPDLPPDEIAAAKNDEVTRVLGNRQKGAASKQLGIDGIYATQKQTVILVDQDDRVRFVERTLFDNDCKPVTGKEGTIDTTFQIEVPPTK